MAIPFKLQPKLWRVRMRGLKLYAALLTMIVCHTRDNSMQRRILLEISRIAYGVIQYPVVRVGRWWGAFLLPNDARANDVQEEPFPEFHHRLKLAYFGVRGDKAALADYLRKTAHSWYMIGHIERATDLARRCYALQPTAENKNTLLRYLLVHTDDTQDEFYCESLHNQEQPVHVARNFKADPNPDRVIHVGILSDFLGGPIGRYTLYPQIKYADPRKVRYFIYDFGVPHSFCRFFTDDYRNVKKLSSQELYDQIRKDRIDILIETNGRLRPHNRYDVLALRAAPIQVNWYNLAATAGSDFIDYSLTDAVATPAGQEEFFYERLYRLPLGAVGGWHLPQIDPILPLPADRNGYVTFGCFGDMFKLNRDVLSAWAKILQRVPTARLYIKNWNTYRPTTRAALYDFFAQRGIAPNRLVLDTYSPLRVMSALYGEIDIGLDTFPYSGGSTTMNALWQGVPVLTLAGKDWRGRTTASIMTSAKLTEFVTSNIEGYINCAVDMAQRLDDLREWRHTMRERLLAHSPYYRIDLYNGDFEGAMRAMWQNWLANPK